MCSYHMYSASTPLTDCACSNGANGLITKFKYKDLSEMYPYVAAYSKAGWNSPNCGKCMKITYNGKSIFITAID